MTIRTKLEKIQYLHLLALRTFYDPKKRKKWKRNGSLIILCMVVPKIKVWLKVLVISHTAIWLQHTLPVTEGKSVYPKMYVFHLFLIVLMRTYIMKL